MSMKRQLFYIANVKLPTPKAHSLQIMQMCNAFTSVQNEFDVILVVPRRHNDNKSDPFLYYDIPNTFRIQSVWCIDALRIARFLGPVAYIIQSFSFLIAARWFVGRRSREHARIYTRELFALLFFSGAFFEAHTFPVHFTVLHQALMRRAAHIFTLTRFLKEKISTAGVETEKISVAPDAVDTEIFLPQMNRLDARRALNLPEGKFLAMYTGSIALYSWKGLDIFLAAASHAPEGVLYVVVGGTIEEQEKFRHKFSKARVLFVPQQLHKTIPLYLAAADVLVLPNTAGDTNSEFYTSPLKLFEYLAAARPIIASDLPSIREAVTEHEVMFVAAGDASALSSAVITLSENKVIAERFVAAALKKNIPTWKKRAQFILAMYL